MNQVTGSTRSRFIFCLILLLGVCSLALEYSPAYAQTPYDSVAVTPSTVGRVGIKMNITAGPSGAPGGFTVAWMTLEDFVANGSDWSYAESVGADMRASFTGTPTKHTEGGTITTYVLDPYQTVAVEIGDLFDETGVTTSDKDELEPSTTYVMTAYVNEFDGRPRSLRSQTNQRTTDDREDCLYTQGYWKNHLRLWPVNTLMLGTVSYTKAELFTILYTPAEGNGLIFLAHQLIATKLNVCAGATGSAIASTVTAADALIGSLVVPPVGTDYLNPSLASDLTNTMDDYNNGEMGSEPCAPLAVQAMTWGKIKALYH